MSAPNTATGSVAADKAENAPIGAAGQSLSTGGLSIQTPQGTVKYTTAALRAAARKRCLMAYEDLTDLYESHGLPVPTTLPFSVTPTSAGVQPSAKVQKTTKAQNTQPHRAVGSPPADKASPNSVQSPDQLANALAGLQDAGYKTLAHAQADLETYQSYTLEKDERAQELAPRLARAGLLPLIASSAPLAREGTDAQAETSHLDSEGTLPEGEGELLLASAPADLANAVETISHTPAEITSLNKLMRKELPITIDLDDPAQTRHCLYRYEVVCLQHHANQDNHVGLLEPRLEQGNCNKFQEKTRLLAVFNWTNTHRGPDGMLPYAGFKSVILQVVGDAELRSRDPPARAFGIQPISDTVRSASLKHPAAKQAAKKHKRCACESPCGHRCRSVVR